MKIIPRAYQKTDTMTSSTEWTVLAFFGADSPLSVHYFECSLVSSVKWWTNASFMVMNRWKISVLHRQALDWNIFMTRYFCSIVCKRGTICRTAFSRLNFQSICDAQHFLKCLSCLLTCAVMIDDHPIPFCEFSSPFLRWSPHLVGHCDEPLAGRTASFKLYDTIFYSCKHRSG